jgi:hypothetical protein
MRRLILLDLLEGLGDFTKPKESFSINNPELRSQFISVVHRVNAFRSTKEQHTPRAHLHKDKLCIVL